MAHASRLRKFGIILLAGLLFLAVLAGGGLFFLNHYLNSPGFLNKIRQEAQNRLGFPVRLDSLRVSLFRGVSLRKLSLASPPSGGAPLLKAEEIRISYRLLPLLHKKIQINEISLVRPCFDLKMNKRGELELPLKPSSSRPLKSKGRPSRSKPALARSSPWTVEVKSLRIKSGSGSLRGPEYSFSVAGLNLNTRLRRAPDLFSLRGRVSWEEAVFNKRPLLRDTEFFLKADISPPAAGGTLVCENFSSRLWEGRLIGSLTARWEGKDQPLSLQGDLSFQNLRSRLIRAGKGGEAPLEGQISGDLTVKGDLLPARQFWPEVRGKIVSPRIQVKSLGAFTNLTIPIRLAGGELKAEPITASLAGGEIRGKFKSDLKRAPLYPFAARLTWSDLNLSELLKSNPDLRHSLGESTRLTGLLSGNAAAEGRLSEADQLRGRGKLTIRDGAISGNPYQKILFQLTGQERLRKIKFDQARADFTLAEKIFRLTSLIIHSYRVKLTSSGSVDLNRGNYLKFKVGLNFHRDLLRDIKPKELRYALEPIDSDPDYRGIEFHLWGVPGKIKSDYQKVLLRKGAAGWLTGEFLKKEKGKKSSSRGDDTQKLMEDGINLLFKALQ